MRSADAVVRHANARQATGRDRLTSGNPLRVDEDGAKIARLLRSHAIFTRRVDRALRFLSDNWPGPVALPADIQRSAPSRRSTESSDR